MAESLFTTQTPTGTNNSDGAPGISTATSVVFAVTGQVAGIRFYATTTVSGTYTAALYQVTSSDDGMAGTGTLLASKVGSAPTGGAWNVITFDSPVSVSTGILYRAAIHSSAGRYVNTSSFFGSALTNGNITAPANVSDPVGLGALRQGTFEVNASLTYPTDEFGFSCYFVDVVFDAGGAGSLVAPAGVAVPAALGAPTLAWSGSVGPGGVAALVALGAPTASAQSTAAPDGIAVSAALGDPTLTWSGGVAPDGLSVPVALGAPIVGAASVAPDGLAVPVALGLPSLSWSGAVNPDGVPVLVAVGAPGAGIPGALVVRPFTGTVARPAAGVVVRPDVGVVSRS